MVVLVKAQPNAKTESVKRLEDESFVVAVKEPPVGGKANAAIARALAGYFNVAPSRVKLISGFSSRQKKFEII